MSESGRWGPRQPLGWGRRARSGFPAARAARSLPAASAVAAILSVPAVLAVLAVLAALLPHPLHAQIRGVLVDAPQVGQRAPALILPVATDTGVGPEPYELRKELGRTVIVGFCVQLADSGCTGFLRTIEQPDSSFGPEVSAVVVTGEPLGVAVAHAGATQGRGRILADERHISGRRWGVPGGSSDRIGVFVVGWDGVIAYRDLQFAPDDLHARHRLWSAVQAARQPRSTP